MNHILSRSDRLTAIRVQSSSFAAGGPAKFPCFLSESLRPVCHWIDGWIFLKGIKIISAVVTVDHERHIRCLFDCVGYYSDPVTLLKRGFNGPFQTLLGFLGASLETIERVDFRLVYVGDVLRSIQIFSLDLLPPFWVQPNALRIVVESAP